MADWGTFATVAGGAAGALTGLLFVAVSIRVEMIARSQELRSRAAQTLALFATVLFISLLLAIPDQAFRVFGIELVALARILDTVAPNAITSVLLLLSGVLIIFHVHAGLDLLVLPVLVALAGGVASAWLLLTTVAA